MLVLMCSIASPIAVSIRARSPLRRAAESSTRRPASCCSVSSCNSRAQRLRSCSDASRLRRSASSPACCSRRHRDRGARGERLQQALVLLVERPVAAQPVEDDQEADGAIAERHRRHERRAGAHLAIRERVRAGSPGCAAGDPDFSAAPASDSSIEIRVPCQPFHALAGDRRDHELVAFDEHDLGRAGVDQRARALDHQLQDPVEIRHAAERAADLGGRLETADGALELVAALTDGPIQAGVGDRDRGPVGEHHGGLFVVVGELAAVLLGQVEVPPRLALDDDRYAEEGGHRGMGERKPVGLRVRADVREAQRPRLA